MTTSSAALGIESCSCFRKSNSLLRCRGKATFGPPVCTAEQWASGFAITLDTSKGKTSAAVESDYRLWTNLPNERAALVQSASLDRRHVSEKTVQMQEDNPEELIYSFEVVLHSTEDIFDDESALAGTKSSVHVCHST